MRARFSLCNFYHCTRYLAQIVYIFLGLSTKPEVGRFERTNSPTCCSAKDEQQKRWDASNRTLCMDKLLHQQPYVASPSGISSFTIQWPSLPSLSCCRANSESYQLCLAPSGILHQSHAFSGSWQVLQCAASLVESCALPWGLRFRNN